MITTKSRPGDVTASMPILPMKRLLVAAVSKEHGGMTREFYLG